MSLNWNIEKVKDKETKKEGQAGIWLDGLIWACLAIDMGKITEQNIVNFYARLKFHDNYVGHLWGKQYTDEHLNGYYPFPEFNDVKAWIGLSTNVSTLTDSAYLTKIKKIFASRLQAIKSDIQVFG